MNREQFLKQLEELLSDVNPAEREEAIKYYEDYFEDANMADEDVIKELGSVQAVATSIREELADKEVAIVEEQSNNSYYNNTQGGSSSAYNNQNNTSQTDDSRKESKKSDNKAVIITAIIVACIFGFPVILPIFITIVSVLFAVIVTLLSLVVAGGACAAAFGAAAAACLIVGFVKLFISPFASLILFGGCMICLGLCFLSALATIKLCTCIIPGFFKGIAMLIEIPFRKKEAVA